MKIAFTGGGTAGHVTPNIALMEKFRDLGWDMLYIGSSNGIERELVAQFDPQLPYYSISCEKLRRKFSFKTFLIPFKVPFGCLQACWYLLRNKVDVVFSKGGFVSLPVVIGAWLAGKPVIAHESDRSPGLANRIAFPFCRKICVTFATTQAYFRNSTKVVITGNPIRKSFFQVDKDAIRNKYGVDQQQPLLLVFGGSMGAESINRIIRQHLPELLRYYQVIHVCGKGKLDPQFDSYNSYQQFEYIGDDFPGLLATADYVISRAGSNSIYELLILHKPHILIPLNNQATRGDQVENAEYFRQQNISTVLYEHEIDAHTLLFALSELDERREEIDLRINNLGISNAVDKIVELIQQTVA